jgi:hypothetical protein
MTNRDEWSDEEQGAREELRAMITPERRPPVSLALKITLVAIALIVGAIFVLSNERAHQERRGANVARELTAEQMEVKRQYQAGRLCRRMKMSAAEFVVAREQYPNGHEKLDRARSTLVEKGEELAELANDTERLNSCGVQAQRDSKLETECVVIRGQVFCPDVDYPDRITKRPIAQRLLQIDDQFSEFDSAAACRTDKDCRSLGVGTDGCSARFFLPYSRSNLVPQEQSDRLKSLVDEYRELDRRLNSLSRRDEVMCGGLTRSPPMRCQVGRCAFKNPSRVISTRQVTRNSNFCTAKPAGRPGDYVFQEIFEADRNNRLSRVAINDNGEVAFVLRTELPGDDRLSVMLFSDKGIQTIANVAMDSIIFVSVNDKGTVAFEGWHGARRGIYTVNPGSSPTMIVDRDDEDVFYPVSLPAINNSGDIAYRAFADGRQIGIGVTDGNDFKTIGVGEEFYLSVINDNGSVAFRASGNASISPAKLFLFKNGEVTVIAADGIGAAYKRIHYGIAINNLDHVAFSVEKHSGETAVLVSADGKIRTVVDDSGPYEAVGSVMGITDGGTVAFKAKGREPCVGGIYTGPDRIADKVIEAGDESDEIQIASGPTTIGEHGIEGIRVGVGAVQVNSRGDFVFVTEDKPERLYLARPAWRWSEHESPAKVLH